MQYALIFFDIQLILAQMGVPPEAVPGHRTVAQRRQGRTRDGRRRRIASSRASLRLLVWLTASVMPKVYWRGQEVCPG